MCHKMFVYKFVGGKYTKRTNGIYLRGFNHKKNMAKYLTNKETQASLERIIIQAEKKLILISPYIKLTNTMLARIKAAADKGVVIKIIFRANKVDKGELERLRTIKNVDLKSTDDLHAKCYFQ